MADTGWLKFYSAVDVFARWDGENNLLVNAATPGECQNNDGAQSSRLTLVNPERIGGTTLDALPIPRGAKITGIAYKIKLKKISGSPTVTLRLAYGSNINRPTLAETITPDTSFETYEFGGENDTLNIYNSLMYSGGSTSEQIGMGVDNLSMVIDSNGDGVFVIDGSSDSPSIKIFYDPLPEGILVTDWTRFTTIDDSGTFSNVGNIESGSEDGLEAQYLFNNAQPKPYYIASGFDFNVPSNAEIVGLEFFNEVKGNSFSISLGQSQIWNGKISTSTFGESDMTDEFFSITSSAGYDTTYSPFATGSWDNTFGLTLTPENIDDLVVGLRMSTNSASSFTLGGVRSRNTTSTYVLASPSVRVYYSLIPTSPTSQPHIPGPRFISSNIDLTKFRGLGDKISPLQLPPSPEDLFGFTSTIVSEGDNSSQATDSVFGDAANFGKLGLNRGGGTGISSDTGLLDTSKAPLSVRKGFRGL